MSKADTVERNMEGILEYYKWTHKEFTRGQQ